MFTDMEFSQIFTWPPTPAKWRALKDYLLSEKIHAGQHVRLSRSSAGVMVSTAQVRRSGGAVRPFTPSIAAGVTPGTWLVASTGGLVIERATKNDVDAPTILHDVEDMAATEIAAGQSLYLEKPTDDQGEIVPPCGFVVAASATGGDVGRYYPPDANGTAAAGVFRVEIAAFELEDGVPVLTPKFTGQHIHHFQDLPTLENAAENDATVLKGYDKDSGAYMFRSIIGLAGIKADETDNNIELSTLGHDFNVQVVEYTFVPTIDFQMESFAFTLEANTVSDVIAYVRGGLWYINPTLDEIPAADRDDEGMVGVLYPRLTLPMPSSAVYHGLSYITLPIP
jgi:hypothetical protein